MDAAHTTKKISSVLAVALLFAGAATAQKLATSAGDNPTVTLSSLGQTQQTLTLSSTDGSAIPFTLTKGTATWFNVTPTSGTTPATITFTLVGSCETNGACASGSIVSVFSSFGTQSITVKQSNTPGGGGGGGSTLITAAPNP